MPLRLHVKTPDGQGYDLSSIASELSYSNVRPGGDESCSFTLRRSWLDSNPEVKRGSIVRVLDGLDTLWQGRLEEVERGASDTEQISVTAFGLGARLKDGLFRQLFVDRDLNTWGEPSRARRIANAAASWTYMDTGVTSDTLEGLPCFLMEMTGNFTTTARCEGWYDAGSDLTIGSMYYDMTSTLSGAGCTRYIAGATANDWSTTVITSMVDLAGSTALSGYVNFSPPTRYAFIDWTQTAGGSEDVKYPTAWRKLAVYGNHGLIRTGEAPGGFTAGQIITYVANLVSGISPRRVDLGSFVITQFVIDTPSSHEDGISEASAFEVSTWGTWGPSSVLDRSDEGYFDFTILQEQTETGDWIISRADCDEISLHDELGSLYNKLRVSWQDSSGEEFVENRTAVIPVLEEAGLGLAASPREQELDAGLGTRAIAQQFGDTYFGIQGLDPPSRGSLGLSSPVQPVNRAGELPPHYMRADGSTVKIRDVLPRSEALSLGRADRRTIFPIQRVSVDASNSAVPQVSVDLDQSPDRLSVIQARMSEGGRALGGGSISATAPAAEQTKKPKAKQKKSKEARRWRAKNRMGHK